MRCEDGRIAALGPGVAPEPGDETIDAAGALLVATPGQRPHPRRDDALPRLGRRPAADALAARGDLAGRGEARARGRLLGHAPCLRGDDPHRHHPLLGHVLAPGGDRARGARRRAAGDGRGAALRRRRRHGSHAGDGPGARLEELAGLGPDVGSALAPHAIYTVSEELLRWAAELAAERELPIHIHLSETEQEVSELPRAARRRAPPPTSTAWGCWASARSSPTGSGSTRRSWS